MQLGLFLKKDSFSAQRIHMNMFDWQSKSKGSVTNNPTCSAHVIHCVIRYRTTILPCHLEDFFKHALYQKVEGLHTEVVFTLMELVL